MGEGNGASVAQKSRRGPADERRSRDQPPAPPWRTEALPNPPQEPQRPRWGRFILWAVIGWFLLFGLTTLQDTYASQVVTVPYFGFTAQVAEGKVSEVCTPGHSLDGSRSTVAPA